MHTQFNVLVIAPDETLRRSLAFALEAEGYAVDARSRANAGQLQQAVAGWGCAIVDEDALADRKDLLGELHGPGRHVVLLVERMRRRPAMPDLTIIEKPPLGRVLLDAVAAALGGKQAT